MSNQNQSQSAVAAKHAAFQQCLRKLHDGNRTFASIVRDQYAAIEEALKSGIQQQAILNAINETYGENAKLQTFKSALRRIRQEIAATRVLGITVNPNGAVILPGYGQIGTLPASYSPGVGQQTGAHAAQMQSYFPGSKPEPRFGQF